MVAGDATPAGGAYGLRLEGLDAARSLLVLPPPHWSEVRIDWVVETPPPRPTRIGEDEAIVSFPSGHVELDRRNGRASFTLTRPLPAGGIVHPFCAPVAVVWARWLDRVAFHAGALIMAGEAWVVMGDKGLGKSSTLAALSSEGFGVLSDDVVVIGGDRAFAGPRCVDLRRDAAERLRLGRNIGVVGARERWRVETGAVAPEVPLAGCVHLEWGSTISVVEVPLAERLALLYRNRALRMPERDPASYLGLLGLPMWRLTRPRSLENLRPAAAQLVEVLSSCGPRR